MSRAGKRITAAAVLILFQAAGNFSEAEGSGLLTAPSSLKLSHSERIESRRNERLVSIFDQNRDFRIASGGSSEEALRLNGERILSPGMVAPDRDSGPYTAAGRRKRNMAISIIGSALLPGLGEMYMYSRTGEKSILGRALGFIAFEAYLWYGYLHNHDRGKDFKRQYEEYGDAHWSQERFLQNHPICYTTFQGGCDSWQQYNEIGSDDHSSEYFYFFYTAKEVDREEYYENMGKYDAFLYGWDDWNGEYLHEGGEPNYWTPHRTYYWDLRGESNKYLLRADYHVMGMIAARVVSMVQAGWIAHNRGSAPEEWSLEIDKSPLDYRCSINYRF
ncbi:MAG: hypothetical protein R6U43_01660 [Candidatus Krumholzibacteriales bacterium]